MAMSGSRAQSGARTHRKTAARLRRAAERRIDEDIVATRKCFFRAAQNMHLVALHVDLEQIDAGEMLGGGIGVKRRHRHVDCDTRPVS